MKKVLKVVHYKDGFTINDPEELKKFENNKDLYEMLKSSIFFFYNRNNPKGV
jgi:hypothetical protein